MTDSPAEWYLVLGLELGRHVAGIVDAYFGPPELATSPGGASTAARGSEAIRRASGVS